MPSLPPCCRLQLKALAILSLYTFVVMLFVSNDSPLASINNHVDSAIFFMSGKAWANGLIPYVDFSDSKGPLLWFIEMVGYWISPTDYHGVWVLSVIVMTLTFYVCWLTAMQVLCRPRLSLCVAMTMAIPYFLGFSFLETRAETWCNLPVAYGVYLVVRLIKQKSNGYVPSLTVTQGAMLGVSVMACLLIKWSIAAMMMSLCLAVLLLSLKSGKKLLKSFGSFISGAALMALPFVVYLVSVGAFVPFLREYFMATAATAGVGETVNLFGFYLNQARRIYHSPVSVASILLGLPGAYMLFCKNGWVKWLLPFCFCFFFAIASYRNHWLYYLQAVLSFSVLGMICIASRCDTRASMNTMKLAYYGMLSALLVIYIHSLYPVYHPDSNFVDVSEADESINNHFGDKNSVKLLCYRSMDVGMGIGVNAIPATKYWTFQTGATPSMTSDQDDALREGRADIIYALSAGYDSLIRNSGYMPIYMAADSIPLGKVRVYIKSPNP